MKTISKSAFIFIGISVLSSCGILNDNLNKAMQANGNEPGSLSRAADTIGEHALKGVNKQLMVTIDTLLIGVNKVEKNADGEFPKILSLLSAIGDTGKFKIQEMGNSVNGTILTLKKNIKDSTLTLFIDKAIFNASNTLNKSTRNLLSNMVQATLDSLNSPRSKQSIDLAFDNILKDTTKLQKAISATVQPTVDHILNSINQMVNKDVPFVQKRATELLILLGAIAMIIIGFVWYEKRKYAGIVEILTSHIDKIKDQNDYDAITGGIKDDARKKKVEPLLRKTLFAQGINNTK